MKLKQSYAIPSYALALLLTPLLMLFVAGCYAVSSSSGGGQSVGAAKGSTPSSAVGGTSETPVSSRTVNPNDVALPPGYRIEAIAQGLTFPTAVTFDDEGRAYVVESGYSYGEVFGTPRLVRVENNGAITPIATGDNGPWTGAVFHDGNFYVAEGGATRGGRIIRISLDGKITSIIDELPSFGDHHTNGPAIGPDGMLYFSIGTATNSGVVGPDNYEFGWLRREPRFHDLPAKDVTLTGKNFISANPFKDERGEQVETGAFLPFGVPSIEGQVIKGQVPCTGGIMKIPLDGKGRPELVAWGMRNPFGLAFSADGQLYATENSYDARGSRPVWGTGDLLWAVTPGLWYGWPDYFAGDPLAEPGRFEAPGVPRPPMLIKERPNDPPRPIAKFGVHSSSNGLDFSREASFGFKGQAFVAQFGDMAPGAGKVLAPVGFRVVRVDVSNGTIEDFAVNKSTSSGPASLLNSGGLERPNAVRFSPDGAALYVVDFGVLLTDAGPQPRERTGVLWRITRTGDR